MVVTLPDIVVALGEADWLIFLLVVVLLLGFQLLGQLLKLDLLLLDAELLVLILHILLLVVLSTLHEVNSDLSDFLGGLIDDWVEFVFLLLFVLCQQLFDCQSFRLGFLPLLTHLAELKFFLVELPIGFFKIMRVVPVNGRENFNFL